MISATLTVGSVASWLGSFWWMAAGEQENAATLLLLEQEANDDWNPLTYFKTIGVSLVFIVSYFTSLHVKYQTELQAEKDKQFEEQKQFDKWDEILTGIRGYSTEPEAANRSIPEETYLGY